MSGLATVRVIYSRVSAVLGVLYWLLGLLCLGLFWIDLFLSFSESVGLRDLFGLLVITAVAILLILIQCSAGFAFISFRDVAKGMVTGRRPLWIFGVFSVAFFIYAVISIVGAASDEIFNWARLALQVMLLRDAAFVAVFVAVFVAALTESHWQVSNIVWRQLRGWRRLPFHGWSEDELQRIACVGEQGRWPDPRTTNMSVSGALAYSWLAKSRLDQWWIFGQLLVLLGGGGVGAGLSFWLSTSETWPPFVVGGAALVGIVGYGFTHNVVGGLTKTVETYDAYVANFRPAAPHGRHRYTEPQTAEQVASQVGYTSDQKGEQQPEAAAPTATVAKAPGFLHRMRSRRHGRMNSREAQAAEGESPSE